MTVVEGGKRPSGEGRGGRWIGRKSESQEVTERTARRLSVHSSVCSVFLHVLRPPNTKRPFRKLGRFSNLPLIRQAGQNRPSLRARCVPDACSPDFSPIPLSPDFRQAGKIDRACVPRVHARFPQPASLNNNVTIWTTPISHLHARSIS